MGFGPQKHELYGCRDNYVSGDIHPMIKVLVLIVIAIGFIGPIIGVIIHE